MLGGWRLLSRAGSWFFWAWFFLSMKRMWRIPGSTLVISLEHKEQLCMRTFYSSLVFLTYVMFIYMVKYSKYTRGHGDRPLHVSLHVGDYSEACRFQLPGPLFQTCLSWLSFSCLIQLSCLYKQVYINTIPFIFIVPCWSWAQGFTHAKQALCC